MRWWLNYDGFGVGLRGGTWSYTGEDPAVFALDEVEFVPGVRVSGTASWRLGGRVAAQVHVHGPEGTSEQLALSWSLAKPLDRAQIDGVVSGRTLRATMLAP